MKLKLPSFSLTQRSARGEEKGVHFNIPRGLKEPNNDATTQKDHEDEPIDPGEVIAPQEGTDFGFCAVKQEPSLHEIKQKSNCAAWAEARPAFLNAAVESNAMRSGQCCILCTSEATYRCVECAAWAYYCPTCFGSMHSKTNIFHTGEVWQDGMYKPVMFQDQVIDVRPPHQCSSAESHPICCIDENGAEHNIAFVCCQCEPIAITMVRARIWPSSPKQPRLAFSFALLDWAEALLLECQVALKDFCKALYFKCPYLVMKRKDIYSSLIDAFEEYRWMKVELRHLNFLCPDIDCGNVCPACPKVSGNLIVSADALFGLPRKKSAGLSFRDALHGHLFFVDQQSVDEFVDSSTSGKKPEKLCSNFLAGDVLRSSRCYHALDETALCGCACRHEFPMIFLNLKHGERLSYAVWLLQELQKRQPSGVTIYFMYDIACQLVRHLKLSNDGIALLESIKFALPSFHAYGHKPACQMIFSPLRSDGFGLSDGEVMERLWSYLRRFSRMTKEMRPAHRVDILAHGLLYYGFKTKQKLATLLVQRYHKAVGMKATADESYKNIVLSSEVHMPVTEEVVESWIEREKNIVIDTDKQTIATTWRTLYFHMLQCYYVSRENLTSTTPESARGKFSSVENQLADFERRHGVVHRWKPSDPEYIDARLSFLQEKKDQLQTSLWSSVVSRGFLLRMKSKYADGQKIAGKLSRSITKESKKAKELLEEYNAICAQICEDYTPLPASEALLPTSGFWQSLATPVHTKTVPWNTQRDAVQALLLARRCDEELKLLEEEMRNVLMYWCRQKECITSVLLLMQESATLNNTFNQGAACLLKQLLWEAELLHSKATLAFSKVITTPIDSTTSSAEAIWSPYDDNDSDDDTDTSQDD